jgi:hypothetical protein
MIRPARPIRLAALLVLAIAAGCRAVREAPLVPTELRWVPRSAWGAHAPVLPMKEHRPTRLTIHHTGEPMSPGRTVAAKLRSLQQFSQRDDSLSDGRRKPAWADVPYHFYVGADGSVGEGREWRYVGDSNTPYDPTGHLLVVVEGNFERDTLTTAQRRTLAILIPALARRFHIPPERLAAHRDFASTACPGRRLYEQLPLYRVLMAE